MIGGEGRILATLVRTNTNLAERSGLLERLIEKPISYIDITALFISLLVLFVEKMGTIVRCQK